MKILQIFVLAVVFLSALVLSHIEHHTKQQIEQKIAQNKIMYGATIRIKNLGSGHQYLFTLK